MFKRIVPFLIIVISILTPGCSSDLPPNVDQVSFIRVSEDSDFVDNFSTEFTKVSGYFPDVTKTELTDNMCWAIAVANCLENTGWVPDAYEVVVELQVEFGNQPHSTYAALIWYFDTFFPNHDLLLYAAIEYDHNFIPEFIASSIEFDRPVMLNMKDPDKSIGHAISIYGYKFVPETEYEGDSFIFLFTHGDDNVYSKQMQVEWVNGEWYIETTFPDYEMRSAINLRSED